MTDNRHGASARLRTLAAVLLLGAAALLVSGCNFGSGEDPTPPASGVWLQSNSTYSVRLVAMTSTYSTGAKKALDEEYNPTHLNVNRVDRSESCQSAASDTYWDVCVFDNNYGDNGVNGWNDCVGSTSGAHPNQTCEHQYTRINQYFSPPAKRVACHELGHSVGLQHTGNADSCLMRTLDGGTSSHLSDEDIGHLDGAY
jgi:hypothetical protein